MKIDRALLAADLAATGAVTRTLKAQGFDGLLSRNRWPLTPTA
jgi:hypothetical protein